jgi:hypothetical protein
MPSQVDSTCPFIRELVFNFSSCFRVMWPTSLDSDLNQRAESLLPTLGFRLYARGRSLLGNGPYRGFGKPPGSNA